MSTHVQVQTSIPSREKGLEIARALIDERLAACAQVVGPITSTYRWRGEVRVDEEYLVLAKTSAARYTDLEARILELHAYSVAEIISTPINSGLASYLTWMDEETQAPAE